MNYMKQKVANLAKRIAYEQTVEIFNIEFLGNKRVLLRVSIDKDGGVTLDDCERFSKSLEALLDVEDPFSGPYTLEVSSPGLDRPLRNIQDFEKQKGKIARIITQERIDNQNFFLGRIMDVSSYSVKVFINNREIEIPFSMISRAKLEIEP